MGKAGRVKKELVDIGNLVTLVQVLKDVADNKYYALTGKKDWSARFGESFADFFRVINLANVNHPLVKNDNPKMGIVALTSEESFLGDLNSKVIEKAVAEKKKFSQSVFIVVGRKGVAKLNSLGFSAHKTFEEIDSVGVYETALNLKNYLIDEILNDRLGKVEVIYPFAKNFNMIKPELVKLLPSEELLLKQAKFAGKNEHVIQESDTLNMIGYLANMFTTIRLYDMLFDTSIAAAAAQSQQLDSSVTNLKKENRMTLIKYRKARKSDIDKSLREVFSARLMALKGS